MTDLLTVTPHMSGDKECETGGDITISVNNNEPHFEEKSVSVETKFKMNVI